MDDSVFIGCVLADVEGVRWQVIGLSDERIKVHKLHGGVDSFIGYPKLYMREETTGLPRGEGWKLIKGVQGVTVAYGGTARQQDAQGRLVDDAQRWAGGI